MTDKFVGVQLGPHSLFDEGVDRCLDILQHRARVNAVMVYTHTHHFNFARPPAVLAGDHGVPVRDRPNRNLINAWVKTHPQYYEGTALAHHWAAGDCEYRGLDVLEELIEPCRARGMELHAQLLEGHGRLLPDLIDNWTQALGTDIFGRTTWFPCWNNPHYRNWWLGMVEDLFHSYPLDGLKWGSERSGPLSKLLFDGTVPFCFCRHCREAVQGVDADEARQGFEALHGFMSRVRDGERPADGVLLTILRLLLKHPAVLAWEQFQHDSRERVMAEMYGTIKAINPEARVGWHIYHAATSFDIIERALVDYAATSEYADYIKPVLYHEAAGPRLRGYIRGRYQAGPFGELEEEQTLQLLYRLFGWDANAEPTMDEERGLSPDYVYRETRRCLAAVSGSTEVYPGIGVDIPLDRSRHWPSHPDEIYEGTLSAFEAGAEGIIISREYDEMSLDSLRAVGRAVQAAEADHA